MPKIDFSKAGKKAGKYFDTDTISIGRSVTIIRPDGREQVTDPEPPLYVDIPCHINITSSDNPNPTVTTSPIIKVLTVNCDVEVDIKNGDLITAYKRNFEGEVLHIYQGICGEPSFSMGRQDVSMEVNTL